MSSDEGLYEKVLAAAGVLPVHAVADDAVALEARVGGALLSAAVAGSRVAARSRLEDPDAEAAAQGTAAAICSQQHKTMPV